jgi:MFS family permease
MRGILPFLLINLFHQTAIQGSRPLVPLLADQLGVGKFEIGLIAATFSVFPLFLAVKAGTWVDKWGTCRPVAAGTTGIALALLLPACFPTIPVLYLSQVLAGISQIMVNISLQNAVGLISSGDRRHYFFGWFTFATAGGQFIGPIYTGSIASYADLTSAFTAAALFSFAAAVAGTFIFAGRLGQPFQGGKKSAVPAPDTRAAEKLSAIRLLMIHGMHQAILASMLIQLTKEVMMTYFPLYATEHGISPAEAGFVLGMQGLAAMFVRLLQGAIMQRIGQKAILFASLFIGGISFILLILFSHVIILGLITGLIGLVLGLVQPLSMAMVVNLSPPEDSGRTLAIRLTGNRLSQLISPVLFGVVAQTTGIVPIFYICGSILITGAFYTSREKRR